MIQRQTWQTLRIWLKGEAEPVDVKTNGLDWAPLRADELQTAGALFHVAHNALLRTGAEVPRAYRDFMEVLDAMPESIDPDADVDPTPADR